MLNATIAQPFKLQHFPFDHQEVFLQLSLEKVDKQMYTMEWYQLDIHRGCDELLQDWIVLEPLYHRIHSHQVKRSTAHLFFAGCL